MKRRLLIANVALLAALGCFGYLLRDRWRVAKLREREILNAKPTASGKLPDSKSSAVPPPRASTYFEVAEKMLFSKDRNPTVVVEVAQEKPVPPMPAAYGVMDLGNGPVVFLAEKGGSQRGYKTGETVGAFKVAAISSQELTFEWEGKTIKKRLDELRGETRDNPQQQQQGAPAPQPIARQPAPAATPVNPNEPWGAETGIGTKFCRPDDPSPPGTVVNGYKKVTGFTPIAKTCFWEPVK